MVQPPRPPQGYHHDEAHPEIVNLMNLAGKKGGKIYSEEKRLLGPAFLFSIKLPLRWADPEIVNLAGEKNIFIHHHNMYISLFFFIKRN